MSKMHLRAGLGVLFFVFIGTGCATTQTVSPDSAGTCEQISERAAGQTVEVVLLGGKRHAAQAFHLRPDSASWYDSGEEEVVSVATDDIFEIRNVVHHGRGALHGLGLGVLSGVVAGTVVGLAGCGDDFFTPFDCAMLGGAMFGGVGLLIGPLVGLAVGSKVTYRLGDTWYDAYPRTTPAQIDRHRWPPRE